MASPDQTKLYLSPAQHKYAIENLKDIAASDLRLGQWLVNKFGAPGVNYPHIFYLDDPQGVWSNVEILPDSQKEST